MVIGNFFTGPEPENTSPLEKTKTSYIVEFGLNAKKADG